MDQEQVVLRVLWRGLDDTPVVLANQFVAQHEQDEIFLTIGQLQPPVLLGTDEERLEQARTLSFLPVNTVARLTLTRARLGELIEILQTHAAKYDEAHK